MKFKLSFNWIYHPLVIISKIRSEKNIVSYVHIEKPDIEQLASWEEWEENTLQEIEEQTSSQTALETPRLKEKKLKRTRESVSPTILGLEAFGFKVFKRRKSMNIEEESLEGENLEEHITLL